MGRFLRSCLTIPKVILGSYSHSLFDFVGGGQFVTEQEQEKKKEKESKTSILGWI